VRVPVESEVVGTRYRWRAAEAEFTIFIPDGRGGILIPFADPWVLAVIATPAEMEGC